MYTILRARCTYFSTYKCNWPSWRRPSWTRRRWWRLPATSLGCSRSTASKRAMLPRRRVLNFKKSRYMISENHRRFENHRREMDGGDVITGVQTAERCPHAARVVECASGNSPGPGKPVKQRIADVRQPDGQQLLVRVHRFAVRCTNKS